MRVAVVGSRSFADEKMMFAELDKLQGISLIVSGGARGADRMGEAYAAKRNIPTKIFLPDWNQFGKSAGFRRNNDIIENADFVLAFWDGKSPGTKSSIDLAKRARKEIRVLTF